MAFSGFLIQEFPPISQLKAIEASKPLVTDLLVQEDEPVTGIVQIGNMFSADDMIFVFGFLSRIYAYNYMTSETLWIKTFGLQRNSDVFIWKMIPNSLQQEEVSGVYVSLSNGTIFEISLNGQLLWTQSLGTLAISSLTLVEVPATLGVPFYIVSGGDNSQITWLTPNGTIMKTHNTTSEITRIATNDGYSLVGTRSGNIYVYNGTKYLWGRSIGIDQILGLCLNTNLVIGYSYEGQLTVLNLKAQSVEYSKDYGLMTYNSIQIIEKNDDIAYLFKNNGDLVAIRASDGSIEWNNLDIPSYVSNIRVAEFTGDLYDDIVISTISGHIFVLNQSSGVTIYHEQITHEQLSELLISDLNDDSVADMIVGTLNGKVIKVLGPDLTPPIIHKIMSNQLLYNSYNITILTNEPVRADVRYGIKSVTENTRINGTFLLTHIIKLDSLQSSSNYTTQVVVYDKNNNSARSEEFHLSTGSAPPSINDLIGPTITFVSILGLLIAAYMFYQRRSRQLAFRYGEQALRYNDYTGAIRYFYKAKAKERVIEVVKILLLNPDLTSEMSEIERMKEIKEYISEAQEMVEQSKS